MKSGFPKAPNWLWRKIKEVRPNLMDYGIIAERNRSEEANQIMLSKFTNSASNASSIQAEGEPQEPGSNGGNGSKEPSVDEKTDKTSSSGLFEIKNEVEIA